MIRVVRRWWTRRRRGGERAPDPDLLRARAKQQTIMRRVRMLGLEAEIRQRLPHSDFLTGRLLPPENGERQ